MDTDAEPQSTQSTQRKTLTLVGFVFFAPFVVKRFAHLEPSGVSYG